MKMKTLQQSTTITSSSPVAMLLLYVIVVILQLSGGVSVVNGQSSSYFLGQDFNVTKWMLKDPNMTDPNLDANGLTLSMIYPISNYITHDMVYMSVWDDNCQDGDVSVADWFNATLVSPNHDYVAGDGESLGMMNITIFTDPKVFNVGEAPTGVADQVRKSPNVCMAGFSVDERQTQSCISDNACTCLFSWHYPIQWWDDSAQGRIRFCLKAGIHVIGNPDQIVDQSETIITVEYDLTDGFEVSFDVAPKVQNEESARDSYGPEGFWCDRFGNEMSGDDLLYMGLPGAELSVCVIPNERTRSFNFGLRQVDSMKWVREDDNGAIVEHDEMFWYRRRQHLCDQVRLKGSLLRRTRNGPHRSPDHDARIKLCP
jgi:hypothetical protein